MDTTKADTQQSNIDVVKKEYYFQAYGIVIYAESKEKALEELKKQLKKLNK